jgi:hypothetical protein
VIATAALSFAALFVAACQVIAGIDELPVGDASTDASSTDAIATMSDGGADSGTDGASCATVPASTCTGPSLPPKPTTGGTGDTGGFVVAISQLRLGFMPDGGIASLDLDCAGTSSGGAGDTCKVHAMAGAHADDPDGGDDGFYSVIVGNGGAGFLKPLTAQQFIDDGRTTIIFQVLDYNGTPNDSSVQVQAFYSGGHFTADSYDIATGDVDASYYAPPDWDGATTWTVDPASAQQLSSAIFSVHNSQGAYISNGVLVAPFPTISVPIVAPSDGDPIAGQDGGIATIVYPEMTSAYVIATISTDAQPTLYDGHLVGRLPTKSLLSAIGPLADPQTTGKSLHDERGCNAPTTTIYSQLKSAFCEGADLALNPKDDGTGSCADVCSAISVAYGFNALPATPLGHVTFPVPNATQCPPIDGGAQRFNCCDDAGADASWTDDCFSDWQ